MKNKVIFISTLLICSTAADITTILSKSVAQSVKMVYNSNDYSLKNLY